MILTKAVTARLAVAPSVEDVFADGGSLPAFGRLTYHDFWSRNTL